MEHEDNYVPPAGAAYEPTDVDSGIAAKFAIWLVVSAVVIHVGLWGLFRFYANYETAQQPMPTYPLAAARGQGSRLPPMPRLQGKPVEDIARFRAEEEQLLRGYSWVDEEAGIVRIPIEEAMRQVIARGLPSRPPDPNAPQVQVGAMPEDSSAGRTYERRTLVPLGK